MRCAPSPFREPEGGSSPPSACRGVRPASGAVAACRSLQNTMDRRAGGPRTGSPARLPGDPRACKYQAKYKRDARRRPAAAAGSPGETVGISSIYPTRARTAAAQATSPHRRISTRKQARTSAAAATRRGTAPTRQPAGRARAFRRPATGFVDRCRSLLIALVRRRQEPVRSAAAYPRGHGQLRPPPPPSRATESGERP